MGLWFSSEFEKYGLPAEQARLSNCGGLSGMDERTRALFERHLKRGVPIARFERDDDDDAMSIGMPWCRKSKAVVTPSTSTTVRARC